MTTLETKVNDFLVQKRIAVAGVSRRHSEHIITRPEVTQQIVHDCGDAGVHRVWMHQGLTNASSVSPEAVEYCRRHDISAIAGACPMMLGDDVDFGHLCMRWFMKLTGGLPT